MACLEVEDLDSGLGLVLGDLSILAPREEWGKLSVERPTLRKGDRDFVRHMQDSLKRSVV